MLYKVYLYYEEQLSTIIEADSQEDAKTKVYAELAEIGTDNLDTKMLGREYAITDINELK